MGLGFTGAGQFDLVTTELTGIQLQQMIIAGSKALEREKERVDALNVFPVPDGDTGTNMHLTTQSAAREAGALASPSVSEVAAAASMGSLMGARGNSGVILSQLFRGFAKGLEGKVTASCPDVAKALQLGVDTAYKAVMKPVEGTILTVARETARGAKQTSYGTPDLLTLLQDALRGGEEALARTPDMLPVLKQAGVVDAGGKGFLIILEGWIAVLAGEEALPVAAPVRHESPGEDVRAEIYLEEITFQYCTELLVKGSGIELDRIKDDLAGYGDCLLVVGTGEVAKIHIHTNNPGIILEYCVKIGSLHEVQIHNMREQSEARTHAEKEQVRAGQDLPEPVKEMGIVAVTVGEGLAEVFRSLGVDEVIEGGQTMNPSAEDILSAVNQVRAKRVFILPNNGNIVLTARQAASLANNEVHVTPTKSIPQGIAAVLAFNSEASFTENAAALDGSFAGLKSGEVTFAVRDSQFDGYEIKAGDILGLVDDKIVVTGKDPRQVTLELVEKMGGGEADLVSVFYGRDVAEEAATDLAEELHARFGQCEVEMHCGGQPLYFYILSVE